MSAVSAESRPAAALVPLRNTMTGNLLKALLCGGPC